MKRQRFFFWDSKTKLLNNVRVFVDYSDGSTNRSSASLQITEISNGYDDDFTITTSDTGSYTWTEGATADFEIGDNTRVTAERIASSVNGTTNFTASAVTGHPGGVFVYINYTASGYISDASSGDTGAWSFYTVNATNGTIRTIYAGSGGAIQPQPIYSNYDGFVDFWLNDGYADFDLDPYKEGVPQSEEYYTNYSS